MTTSSKLSLLVSAFTILTSISAVAAGAQTFEAESAQRIGAAGEIADRGTSGGTSITLAKPGQGIKCTSVTAANKLAIRYASIDVGTISVAVNDQPPPQVNVHSSGALRLKCRLTGKRAPRRTFPPPVLAKRYKWSRK